MNEKIASLVTRLGREIGSSKLTIATAESCTGGMICAAITANPEVSGVLERGFVVYSPDAKCDLLGLDRGIVEACHGVSRNIAIDMARAALERSRASIAVATTGFAGPRENNEEVGLVHIAVATRSAEVYHREEHFGELGRKEVCQKSVSAALQLLIHTVRSKKTNL